MTFLGTDIDHDGGKVILVAGARRPPGTTNTTCCSPCGRSWTARARRSGWGEPGPVFVGEIGPSYRRTFTVMGDTVNLAARVSWQRPARSDPDDSGGARPVTLGVRVAPVSPST